MFILILLSLLLGVAIFFFRIAALPEGNRKDKNIRKAGTRLGLAVVATIFLLIGGGGSPWWVNLLLLLFAWALVILAIAVTYKRDSKRLNKAGRWTFVTFVTFVTLILALVTSFFSWISGVTPDTSSSPTPTVTQTPYKRPGGCTHPDLKALALDDIPTVTLSGKKVKACIEGTWVDWKKLASVIPDRKASDGQYNYYLVGPPKNKLSGTVTIRVKK